mmetsp:Transcript_17372/g.20590  ORF Transcript_17372/g.20590 Transcript_17372/m.20590 type:complete len:128 (-) Transcript_17372:1175-1558(-)
MFNPETSPPSTGRMIKVFLKLSIPNIVTNLLAFLCNVTLVVFAGRMDDPINVAVVGLCGTCCAVMAKSLMIGLNCAQEMLTSQAFGAGNTRLCGTYLNRGMVVLLAFFVPIAFIPSLFAEKLFKAIG